MDPTEFTKRLTKAADNYDKPAAALLSSELIAHLLGTDEAYPPKEAERAMQVLRNQRWFELMREVGDALIQTGRASIKVQRLYAQSLIDQGELTAALSVLTALSIIANTDPIENPEVRGLIGRVHKQFYINSNNSALPRNREHLRRAITSYLDVYTTAPEAFLWHGINVVACVKRAHRDGVPTDGFPDPDKLAKDILGTIEARRNEQTADTWDFATAVEASVALNQTEGALTWLALYARAPYTHAFEVGSTLRQLEEVWQLKTVSELGSKLLPILRATLLSRKGGAIEITPQSVHNDTGDEVREAFEKALAELRAMLLANPRTPGDGGRKADPELKLAYEKVFGDDNFITLRSYQDGLHRCRFVARIGRDPTKGHGTGFAMRGSDLWTGWGDEPVILTNAHVVSDDPSVRDALQPLEVVLIFELLGTEEYRVGKLLWTSPPNELDATVLQLENIEPLKARQIPPLLRCAKKLPIIEDTAQVYVIGHPGGGTLSISLKDNRLLDHQDPRLHYRAPTEGGSSGSPVFNRQWDLIGLHHSGSEKMPMLNGKAGTYAANEGIWIQAIIRAIAAGGRRD